MCVCVCVQLSLPHNRSRYLVRALYSICCHLFSVTSVGAAARLSPCHNEPPACRTPNPYTTCWVLAINTYKYIFFNFVLYLLLLLVRQRPTTMTFSVNAGDCDKRNDLNVLKSSKVSGRCKQKITKREREKNP